MSILNKHLVFVNEQVAVQSRLAKKYAKDNARSALHTASRDSFIHLLDAMNEADEALDKAEAAAGEARSQVQTPALTLTPDELEGLPKELLQELSEGAVPDKIEAAILAAIRGRDGIASLDQILVAVYRQTGELVKRNTLTSKLYRMAQKQTIYSVPEKKGAYSLKRISFEDAQRMFGASDPEGQQQQLVYTSGGASA